MQYQTGAVRPVESITQGWELIKSNYWTFFLMTFVALIILFVAAMLLGLVNNLITYGVAAAMGVATQNAGSAGKISASIVPQLVALVIGAFVNIVVGVISGALFCGIYRALARQADSGIADFGDLFSGFQKIKQCLVVSVFLAIVQFVLGLFMLLGGAAIGFSALGTGILTSDGKLNPAIFGSFFAVIMGIFVVYMIVSLIISALTSFAYPLIADREISGIEALTTSIKGGFSNLGGLIGLLILLGLMAFVGALCCIIGVFFVAPVFSAALFVAFRAVFGKPDDFRQYSPPSPPVFNDQPQF